MERDLATRLKHAEALIQRHGCISNDKNAAGMKQIFLTPREEQLCESENEVAGQGSKHGRIIREKDYLRYVERCVQLIILSIGFVIFTARFSLGF
jgi:hypothetical protein